MDLKIVDQDKKFKCRVNGILVQEGKVLGVKINDNNFYCCPGGHVELGEDSKTAMIREFKEETGLDVKIEKLVCIMENFFEGGEYLFHEISFYYLLSCNNLYDKNLDFKIEENDKGKLVQLDFKWFDLQTINDEFRPSVLKEKLKNGDFNFEHIILKEIDRK